MPKGENLEKPKKGGMVLIIGMGAKPKKDKEKMKKEERRRPPKRGGAGAKPRAQKHRFLQLMRKNPNHFEETLKHLKIPRQLF